MESSSKDAMTMAAPTSDVTRSWFEHLRNVVQNHRDITKQIQQKQEEQDRLRNECAMMTLQQENITTEIESAARMYSQLLCQPFCIKMCTTLPRELRDRIYGYLLGPPKDLPWPLREPQRRCIKSKFFDATYVGPQFATEIQEMAYRTETTLLCTPFSIPHCLGQSFGGVSCADCIRSLVVEVDLQDRFCRKACHPQLPADADPIGWQYTFEELRNVMKPLFFVKHKEGFSLELRFCHATSWSNIQDALEAVKPVLIKLRRDGMVINIGYYQRKRRVNRFPDNLMQFYDGTLENWEQVCKDHRKRLRSEGVVVQQALSPIPPPPRPPPFAMMPPPPPPPPIFVPVSAALPRPDSDSDPSSDVYSYSDITEA